MTALEVAPALGSLEAVRAWVRAVGDEAGLEAARVQRLVRAVDEIATNAVVHGQARGPLALRAEVDAEGLRIVLEDDGVAFDPRTRPSPRVDLPLDARVPGGLGVHLARQSVDELDYARVDGRNRNTFKMHRREQVE